MAQFALPGMQTLNTTITRFLQGYRAPRRATDILFPITPMNQEKGDILTENIAEITRVYDTLRANGDPSNTITRTFSTNGFDMAAHSLNMKITQRDMEEAKRLGGVFTPIKQRAAMRLMESIFHEEENRALVEITANATAGSLAGNKWNDSSGVTIEVDLRTQRQSIRNTTGHDPNFFLMSRDVADVALVDSSFGAFLSNHTTAALLKKGQTGEKAAEVFGDWTNFPTIFIADSLKNSAIEGQTASNGQLWSDTIVMAYVAPLNATAIDIGHGYNFRKKIEARDWFDNNTNSIKVEVEVVEDIKIIQAGSVIRVTDVLV